ncbi:mitochondrial cardiolipin hydrolase [Aulostomus maculatus]
MSVRWAVKAVGLGVAAISVSVELLCWLLRRLGSGTRNEVLFFPSDVVCVQHIFSPTSPHSCSCSLPHGVETSFSHFLRCILSASSSLDICIFAFSNMDLSRAVVALHRRRVTIRVITDKDYAAISGSQIGVLRKAGINVRCGISSIMHHKFAVVDDRLLLTGSLNWTLTAVQCNMENVLITDEPKLVRPFAKEFQKLWVRYDPDCYHPLSDQKPVDISTRTQN